eukprot:Em0021g759a
MTSYLAYFFPGDCYKAVIEDLTVPDATCMKLAIGRFLSLGIILGSVLVKLPQIIKIISAGSVENLAYSAFLLELIACMFTSAYNYANGFPFSTWGETLFITIQVIILLSLMFYYNRQTTYALAFPPLVAFAAWILSSGILSMDALTYCQAATLPIMLLSRVSQIISTYRNGSTGQLSFITGVMNAMGTGARVFTTLNEIKSQLLLVQSLAMFTVNTLILLQFFLYWRVPSTKVRKD